MKYMKLLFTTVHPAPYFDRLFSFFSQKDVDVEAWYEFSKVEEKNWKTYHPKSVHLYKEKSFLSKALHFSKFDFVILHWGNKENILIALILKIKGKKFAYYLDHPDPSSSKTKGAFYIFKRAIMKMATYMFPACYSCADYLKEIYKISDEKIRVWPYSHSEAPKTINVVNDERIKAIHNGAKVKLLIASRFIERKGYSIVFQAFKLLASQGVLSEYDINVVGNGELYEEYKSKFSKLTPFIHFFGWIENDDYERMLNETDVYLHPSLFEPFGIPPLDAMERKKFVVSTDAVKSMDIFANVTGVKIYPAYDSMALAKILKYIIKNKDEIYSWTENNPRFVQQKYSMNVNYNVLCNESISKR